MNLIPIAKAVSEIARRAGAAIMEIYENEADFQVEKKGDESPLTIADQRSNQLICEGLAALDVSFPIVSEENKEIPYEERKNFEYHWLVDPLDGTKEFIKRNGEFTVNIALIHEGRPVLGVVFVPATDELFWAVERAGAFRMANGEILQLNAAEFTLADEGLRIVTSRSHLNDATRAFVDRLQHPETVARGSSLKFTVIAQGAAHVYPRLGPTMEWDTGAAQIVLEEAGGKVIDEETGEPLRYNKENLRNPYFIAYGQVQDANGSTSLSVDKEELK